MADIWTLPKIPRYVPSHQSFKVYVQICFVECNVSSYFSQCCQYWLLTMYVALRSNNKKRHSTLTIAMQKGWRRMPHYFTLLGCCPDAPPFFCESSLVCLLLGGTTYSSRLDVCLATWPCSRDRSDWDCRNLGLFTWSWFCQDLVGACAVSMMMSSGVDPISIRLYLLSEELLAMMTPLRLW